MIRRPPRSTRTDTLFPYTTLSRSGFTDVLLTKGAARVYAVDSGTNQLAWKLRQDDRVIVHEQTSARILTWEHIPEPIDLVVCDASFISLAKVLERPLSFAAPSARLIARSEEHTSELQSLMRISYACFCLEKDKKSVIQRQASIRIEDEQKWYA